LSNIFLSIAIIIPSVVLSCLGLWAVHRLFPHDIRQKNNEAADFFLSVLGVVYGILLAFVVVVVWQRFETARDIVEKEGNAVASLVHEARALSEPGASRVSEAVRSYVNVVVSDEWPAMAGGQRSPQATKMTDELWDAVTGIEPKDDRENAILGASLQNLNELTDARRLRLLAAQGGLPPIMWVLLIGGGVITVILTYFFSCPNLRAQIMMTALFVASLAFVLFLIAAIDYPFRGELQVTPEPLLLVLETFSTPRG
jgi:Protein of unknown function (DUF4239)